MSKELPAWLQETVAINGLDAEAVIQLVPRQVIQEPEVSFSPDEPPRSN